MLLVPTLDLTPGDLNLALVAGDGLALTFTFNVDLTGYTPSAAVVERKSRNVVQAITAVLAQPNPGVVTLMLTDSETLPLVGRALDWWLVLTPSGGEDRTAVAGRFLAGPR